MAYTKQAGVYYLKNTSNGFKVYIGSSVDMRERLTAHFSALKRGDHRCKHLQCIYDKYGENSIELGVIQEYPSATRAELRKYERYHIDKYLEIFPRSALLNGTLNTECPLDDPEVSERQKQAAKDFWNNNPEFREATISRGRERLSKLNKDEAFCAARDERFGKLNSDPTFQKKRQEAMKKVCAKPVICLDTEVVFGSAGEAARWLQNNGKPKASQSAIGLCCRGGLKTAYKLRWCFAT